MIPELGHTQQERLNISTVISFTFIAGTAVAYLAPTIWGMFIPAFGRVGAIRMTFTLMAAVAKLKALPDTRKIPVMMLTAKDSELDVVAGLDGGADDYMTKPFGILEFSARIRNLLKRFGEEKEEDKRLAVGDISIDLEKREVKNKGEAVELTLKEYELLCYLMENTNRVVTREELLDRIWGYDYDGETRTLDMHIKTLRQKLKESGHSIKTIRGVGYRIS